MILTEKELSQHLKVSTVYLYTCRKQGMPYLQLSHNCIRYELEDVMSWIKQKGGQNSEPENQTHNPVCI